MKILITGISGSVGGCLGSALSKKHEIIGVYNCNKPEKFETGGGT